MRAPRHPPSILSKVCACFTSRSSEALGRTGHDGQGRWVLCFLVCQDAVIRRPGCKSPAGSPRFSLVRLLISFPHIVPSTSDLCHVSCGPTGDSHPQTRPPQVSANLTCAGMAFHNWETTWGRHWPWTKGKRKMGLCYPRSRAGYDMSSSVQGGWACLRQLERARKPSSNNHNTLVWKTPVQTRQTYHKRGQGWRNYCTLRLREEAARNPG